MLTVTVILAFLGVATNAIQKHHEDSKPLRDLYHQYNLDPDDEISKAFFYIFRLFTLK